MSNPNIVSTSDGSKQLVTFSKIQQKVVRQNIHSEDEYLSVSYAISCPLLALFPVHLISTTSSANVFIRIPTFFNVRFFGIRLVMLSTC